MSVNTSEEYLDELLQAIEPIIYKNEPEPIVVNTPHAATAASAERLAESAASMDGANDVSDNRITDEGISLDNLITDEGIATEVSLMDDGITTDIPGIDENVLTEDTISLDSLMSEDTISLESLVAEAAGENGDDMPSMDAASMEDVSMDDLLAALTAEESAEVMDVDAMISAAAEAGTDGYDTSMHDNDVKELLKQFSDDEDLSDIGEILSRDENSEAVDESVLITPEVEVFQLEEGGADEEETEPVKEKKGFFGRFKKNKKKKKKEAEEQQLQEMAGEALSAEDEIDIAEEAGEFDITMSEIPDMLVPEETPDTVQEPRSDVSIEMDEMDIGSLMNFGESEATAIGGDELDLGNLFGDGDMTDIDQLLAAGSFEELGEEEQIREKKDDKAADGKASKKGFFGRLFEMLLEEDEEESSDTSKKAGKKGNVPEADETGVTDENLGILDELSKEDKKKAKKEKKEQKKKEKEAKKKGKALPEGEEDPDAEGDDKKKKKKKVKKEKPRKVEELNKKPEKKLSRKKVSVVFLFCFSILAVILLFKNVVLDFSNLKAARWAFDNADYETCYLNLYGEELSEKDEAIFQKSYIILCVQRKWDSYENFKQMDMEVEALNALFDGVRVYRNIELRANELGIVDRIAGMYQTIYGKLGEYGLSNEEIEEILDYDSKVTYTQRLNSIVNGTSFDAGADEAPEVKQDETVKPMEDVLPQEQDFLQ